MRTLTTFNSTFGGQDSFGLGGNPSRGGEHSSDCSHGINGSIREIGNQVLPRIEKIEPE